MKLPSPSHHKSVVVAVERDRVQCYFSYTTTNTSNFAEKYCRHNSYVIITSDATTIFASLYLFSCCCVCGHFTIW